MLDMKRFRKNSWTPILKMGTKGDVIDIIVAAKWSKSITSFCYGAGMRLSFYIWHVKGSGIVLKTDIALQLCLTVYYTIVNTHSIPNIPKCWSSNHYRKAAIIDPMHWLYFLVAFSQSHYHFPAIRINIRATTY